MTSYKEIIQKEYVKCATSPVHFISKYCYIQNLKVGRMLFNLFPFQAEVLKIWQKMESDSIVNKSRQIGLSTLVAGFALWLMLFHRDKQVLCIATKQDVAKNMVTKVRYMYDNLPSWLKIGEPDEKNKLTLKLSNGSQIKAVSAASDSGRSESANLLILDEAAYIENPEEIWGSSQQTLASTGGKAIIISTPSTTGTWFHRNWIQAEENSKNGMIPIKLPWYLHPERDQRWRDDQDKKLGKAVAAQECDCVFGVTGETFFSPEILKFYEETFIQEPNDRRGVNKDLWVWKNVDYNKKYMVVADVARGDSKDYSAAQVIDIEACEQVAEYKGQMSTKDFGHFLVGLASEYNDALLVLENSSIGWSTIQVIQERGYRNFYYSPKNVNQNDISSTYFNNLDPSEMVPGFKMTLQTRPALLLKFQEYVLEKALIIRSKRLLKEMDVFIWKNGRPEAQYGYNDDLVISMAIGMYLRDTAFKINEQNIKLTKNLLNNIQKHNIIYSSKNTIPNPYKMNIGGEEEDLKWLL